MTTSEWILDYIAAGVCWNVVRSLLRLFIVRWVSSVRERALRPRTYVDFFGNVLLWPIDVVWLGFGIVMAAGAVLWAIPVWWSRRRTAHLLSTEEK